MGGSEGNKKIHWVAWSNICKEKADGGLGLKDLKSFTYALLGKWLWRLKTENNALWVNVLKEKYSVTGEVVLHGGRLSSGWWSELLKLEGEDSGFKTGWFSSAVRKVVGDGRNTLFWKDPWLEGGPLNLRYQRLFSISMNKSGLYSVRSAYKWLVQSDRNGSVAFYNKLWKGDAPLKVKAFVWKLAKNRIPSLQNLVMRNVPLESQVCVGCKKEVESAGHLFSNVNFLLRYGPTILSGGDWKRPFKLSVLIILCIFLGLSTRLLNRDSVGKELVCCSLGHMDDAKRSYV